MKNIKRILAVLLSMVMILSVTPVVKSNGVQADDDIFCITCPKQNQLMAAGHIYIEWTAIDNVKEYKLYIDEGLEASTKETKYDYYSTKVVMHSVEVVAELEDGTEEKTNTVKFAVSKKGLAVNEDMGKKLDPLKMNMSWYYTWGTTPFTYTTTYRYAEFVPMIWGTGDEGKLDNIAKKKYKYMLGYNEPDMDWTVGGSNINVNTAINNWYKFDGKSDYLGAPAPALSPSWDSGTWFRTFMDSDKVNRDNIDFIPLHCYYGTYGGKEGAETFLKEVVDDTYEMYHKPIWITEFAVSGWGYSDAAARKSVQEFMKTVIKGLNERDYVERYSWFSFNTTDKYNGASALWTNDTGVLTDLGKIYVSDGNPEGYVANEPTELAYKLTNYARKSTYDKRITINHIDCENYVRNNNVTAEASSVIDEANSADKAIDGSIENNSRWESEYNIDPVTFTLDLGKVNNIKQLNIMWESAGAMDYTVEASTDGEMYTTVADITDLESKNYRNDKILFTKQFKARYIKITGTMRTSNYGYSIWEIAAYGSDDFKIDETTTPSQVIIQKPTTNKNDSMTAETTTVKLKRTTVTKAKKNKKSKKAKISLKKVSKATRYEVQISTSRKFKKVIAKKTFKKNSGTISSGKIKNKKKLYVRARAYTTVKGIKNYGNWSKVKKITVKK